MRFILASAITVLAISVLSCSHSQEVVSPIVGARQGSPNPTPAPSPTTAPTSLPTLIPAANPINDLGPIMPAGTWTVKSYYRAFSEKSDYSGYKFVFAGNVVTATDSKGNVYSGSWFATIGGQVPYYGGAPSITALTMSFTKSAPKELLRLSATWNVNLATATTDVVLDNFEPLSGERIEFAL